MDPMPSPRPRFRVIGKFASAYMPADYKKWKASVAEYFTQSGINVGDATVSVTIACYAPRPKTTKLPFPSPDVDNYAKSLMDAATEAGVWLDDKQVKHLEVSKDWNSDTQAAGMIIAITEL